MIELPNGGFVEIRDEARGSPIFAMASSDQQSQKLLSQPILHSKFRLMETALSATPAQVKWWRFRSTENERIIYLLTLKFSALLELESLHPLQSPFYSISVGKLRGFQLGSPTLAPCDVHLDLFDQDDRYFALDFVGPDGHGPLVTQEQINAIVASLGPAPRH